MTVPLPSVSWNTDNGNPRIIRFQDNSGYLIIDPASDLFSIQSWGDGQFGCNSPPVLYRLQDVQAVVHNPDDIFNSQINLLAKSHGGYVAVFQDWSGWFATGMDCAALFPRKLAEGTGNLVNTDNDLFAFASGGSNANAFGIVANGQLTLVGGGRAAYTGTARCVGNNAIFTCNDSIKLR
jgi:hypothetical protein